MGVQRPAERHFVRRRPPPEREAARWVELADSSGRVFWLDAGIWMRPVQIRSPEDVPSPLAAALAAAASGCNTREAERPPSGPAAPAATSRGQAPSLRFLHEALFYELLPSAVGLDDETFAASVTAFAAALEAAGCEYSEIEN
ncbi:MAG: hypothetical protein IJ783_01005 [Kiritimatiellae bacterium]|nr:hypothetical protein [Kiritimatiellia bacterium]